VNGPQHFEEAERLLTVGAGHRGSEIDAICTAAAQVHATLALAPAWLRCFDQINGTGTYPLNAAHVMYFRRVLGGEANQVLGGRPCWWYAIDSRGESHQILSDDDATVEALIGGQP
jgi:hypothetical protein